MDAAMSSAATTIGEERIAESTSNENTAGERTSFAPGTRSVKTLINKGRR
jgi:hypothetical protein